MSNAVEAEYGGGPNQGPEVAEEREDGEVGFQEALEDWEGGGDEVQEKLTLKPEESGRDGGQSSVAERKDEGDGLQEATEEKESGGIELQDMMESLQETERYGVTGTVEEAEKDLFSQMVEAAGYGLEDGDVGTVEEPENEEDLFSQMVEAAGYGLEEEVEELESEGDGAQETVKEQEAGGGGPQEVLKERDTEAGRILDAIREKILEWEARGDGPQEMAKELGTRAAGILGSVREEIAAWEAGGDRPQEIVNVQNTEADEVLPVVDEEITEQVTGAENEAAAQSSHQQEMELPMTSAEDEAAALPNQQSSQQQEQEMEPRVTSAEDEAAALPNQQSSQQQEMEPRVTGAEDVAAAPPNQQQEMEPQVTRAEDGAATQSSQQQEMEPPVNVHLTSQAAAVARVVKKGKGRRYGKPITEKWRPVYEWLESLNQKEVVKTTDIQEWLNEHADIKQRLTQSHSMDHIFNYIQKCHSRMITDPKDRKAATLKIVPERREAPTVLREVRLKRALKKATASPSEQPNGGVRSHQPGHGQGQEQGQSHSRRGRKRKRWGMGTTQRPRSVGIRLGRFGPSGTRGRHPVEKGKEPAVERPGVEGSSAILPDSYADWPQEARSRRYELLAALRSELVDLIGNFRELPREKFPGTENGPDSFLLSQPGSSKEKAKGPAAVFAWSFSEATPGGDPAPSLGEGKSVHPEKGNAKAGIPTTDEKVTKSIFKCLSDREQGGHSATVAFRPSVVGRHGRQWTSFVRGWNSLDSQFKGPVTWLQRQDYSSWCASWCAYTSSVALAPLGGVDQGVQKVLDLRLHPGGLPQLVCSCNAAPNELLLYNLANGRARELAGHNCQIQAVEYALNGDLIVSCGTNILKVWDSASGTCLYTMGPRENDGAPGHKKKISAMAVHQSQSCLVATSGGEGESDILLWNVRTGELASDLNLEIRQRRSNLQSMDALQFCHDNLLICGSDSSGNQPAVVQIWDVDAGKDLLTVPACDSYITCLSTDPRGRTVITGAGDGTVGLFDIRGGGAIARLPLGLNTEATSVAFSACGTFFHSSCSANHTLVWDTRMISMEPGPVPKEQPVAVSKLDARETRPLHCLSHGDPMPTTQNAGQLPGFVDEGDGGVNDARWCRHAPVLVTASGNGSVAIWDVALAQPCLRQLSSHSRCINTVAISPSDQLICSGGDDQKVVLYHNSKAESIQGWKLTHPMRAELQAVATSEQQ